MCLLVLAWQAHRRYRLVVAANRDEYHQRAAAPLSKWPPPAELLAGRDLHAGGTWLGIDRARRFGVVTNFRELQRTRPGAPSRGDLIPGYLGDSAGECARGAGAARFFASLRERAHHYSGFNLLLTDAQSLWYGSNRARPFARELSPGVYGLSNELLDTPWPKLQRVRAGFQAWLRARQPAQAEELFALLADRTPAEPPRVISLNATGAPSAADKTRACAGTPAEPPPEIAPNATDAPSAADKTRACAGTPAAGALPADESGLPREWQRALSAPFVLHGEYGTRCSTVLLLDPDGALDLIERRFDAHGNRTGESAFHLDAGAWP